MKGQLRHLRDAGFDVTVVTSPGPALDRVRSGEGVNAIAVPMIREIASRRDALSLLRFWRVMRRVRPILTNVSTPKAGLLGGIAAWLSRVPCRVYTLRGLRCETTSGLKRQLLWLSERIACSCAHRVLCVSESLRRKALELRIVNADRALVLGPGSSHGVDVDRFGASPELSRRASLLRQRSAIPPGAPVLGFVGRLTRDKGIPELLDAYDYLLSAFPDLRLLLVGDYEEGDPIDPLLRNRIETDPKIIRSGFVEEIEAYYQVIDVLVLPTYREGFPNVILEAHAAGKPVVATRATGVVDAVIDSVTGILVPIGDSEELAKAVAMVLKDEALAARLGNAGRARVLREFRQELIWDALLEEYRALLRTKGQHLPEVSGGDSVPVMARV
jgi:glycosyltransferase involved in cell wall biosynthesis